MRNYKLITMSVSKLIFESKTLSYSWDPETHLISFTATIPNHSYFSIGFGTRMKDTDMILW